LIDGISSKMSREDERQQRLEALLQAWTTRHMLPAAQSESIRLAIPRVTEPAVTEPGIGWWHQLFGTLDIVLGRTTDMFRYLDFRQTA